MHTKDIELDFILESVFDEAVSSESESEVDDVTVAACDDQHCSQKSR
jgi:hypothetical protein